MASDTEKQLVVTPNVVFGRQPCARTWLSVAVTSSPRSAAKPHGCWVSSLSTVISSSTILPAKAAVAATRLCHGRRPSGKPFLPQSGSRDLSVVGCCGPPARRAAESAPDAPVTKLRLPIRRRADTAVVPGRCGSAAARLACGRWRCGWASFRPLGAQRSEMV